MEFKPDDIMPNDDIMPKLELGGRVGFYAPAGVDGGQADEITPKLELS
jgi:hypothetical protein